MIKRHLKDGFKSAHRKEVESTDLIVVGLLLRRGLRRQPTVKRLSFR